MENNNDILGKKIVFVHPPDIVKKDLLHILTDKEFEVYLLLDLQKIPEIHDRYPESLFFLNIDAAQTERDWQDFISELNVRCRGIQFGIFSFKISAKEQIQVYLLELGASCGFIQLKQGVAAASDMMMKVLTVNEAKGRRKYIRYQCSREDLSSVNFQINELKVSGEIQDISSVGMSCTLDHDMGDIVKNQLIRNMQFRLRGILANLDAILMGTRTMEGGTTIYVFLFKADYQDKMKSKIRSFISSSLQKNFEKEFFLRQ